VEPVCRRPPSQEHGEQVAIPGWRRGGVGGQRAVLAVVRDELLEAARSGIVFTHFPFGPRGSTVAAAFSSRR
jgi:hypothetical protein